MSTTPTETPAEHASRVIKLVPKKTIVIHHSADFDGLFCREIARKFLPDAGFIGWDYGQPVPPILPEVETIYMLDISIPELMSDPRLIWIDHHKSAIDKYPASAPGLRIDGVAACRLAWQWFAAEDRRHLLRKEMFVTRVVREPFAVRLAGEYDIWDRRDPRAELFQHGLRSRDLTAVWPELLRPNPGVSDIQDLDPKSISVEPDGTIVPSAVMKLLEAGVVLQYAKRESNAAIIAKAGFTVDFEGIRFLACNASPGFNSHLFDAGLREEHQACLGFNFNGQKWRVSLYHAPGHEDLDLSKIAVKYGGGGHKGACGFEVTEPFAGGKLPFPTIV